MFIVRSTAGRLETNGEQSGIDERNGGGPLVRRQLGFARTLVYVDINSI